MTIGFGHAIQEIFRYSEFMLTKQPCKIPKQCALYSKHFLPISLTVLPKMISRLFWLSEKRVPTLSSHQQIVNELNPAKD
jgi:hypothetical protein